jgi:hypothetical protein
VKRDDGRAGEVEHARHVEALEGGEHVHEREGEEAAAEDVAKRVEHVDAARRAALVVELEERGRERQDEACDEAVGEEQEEGGRDDAGQADRLAAYEHDVAQAANQDDMRERHERHEHLQADEPHERPAKALRELAEHRADAGKQQPVGQHDAHDELIAGERAEELAHDGELRDDG